MSEAALSASVSAPALRRAMYVFLRYRAGAAWSGQARGALVTMPPQVLALPASKRCRVHAGQEADRLAHAPVYALDSELADLAVRLGGRLWCPHPQGPICSDVIGALDLQPPSLGGFVYWQDPGGVGYGRGGAPIIACHWGPVEGAPGRWVAWWSAPCPEDQVDAHAVEGSWSFAAGGRSRTGLRYDCQALVPDHPTAGLVTRPPPTWGGEDASFRGLLCTTLMTWSLLRDTGTAHLTRYRPSDSQIQADRRAGLPPRGTIVATPEPILRAE